MNQNPKLNNYVSEIDHVLKQFDSEHAPSASQKIEIAKAERITELRDHAHPVQNPPKIWDKF